jgi:hypothetical protein
MIINFIYVIFEFIINWLGRPYFDLKLIKGHQFCINKHKVLSFYTHQLLTQEERYEICTQVMAIG